MNYSKIFFSALSLVAVLLFSACATTYEAPADRVATEQEDEYEGKMVRTVDNPLSLDDFLMRAPGVSIQGNRVLIRGAGPPLFILDGIPLGNSYASTKNAVNPLDVASVEVVSGPETAMYGRRGANGVIIIKTKTF
jgi:TonB-dependent SusC/RagA subfamily outer membrane receptor